MEDKPLSNLLPTNETEPQPKPRKWTQKSKKIALWTLVALVAIYLLAAIILYPMQKSFMYKPKKHTPTEALPKEMQQLRHRQEHHTEDDLDWHWKRVKIDTSDGETLSCYWLKSHSLAPQTVTAKKDLFTVIYFHGRSGSIHDWVSVVEKLQSKVRCNVLMVSYRGYGDSTGSPDEAGMKLDAQAALEWTLKQLSPDQKSRLVIYGQSMGGAVAIHLAATNPTTVKYLIVDNTFLNLPSVAARESPFFTLFRPLIHQVWDSAAVIKDVKCKILFLSAKNDKFIPSEQMTELHKLATGSESAKLVPIPKGGHNSAYLQPEYSEAIETFLYPAK